MKDNKKIIMTISSIFLRGFPCPPNFKEQP